MNQSTIERALQHRGSSARELSPTAAQVSAAVGAARRDRRRGLVTVRRGLPVPALGLAALLVAGAGALAAMNVLNPHLGSFLGGGSPPGRPLTAAETPRWLKAAERASGHADASLAASAGSHRLIAYRDSDGSVCFGYGGSVGECAPPAYFREELAKHPIILRGPTLDHPNTPDTHGTLFGFVDARVAKVRLDYPDRRSALASAANGAFVVRIAVADRPTRLVGLAADGKETASLDLSKLVRDELEAIAATQPTTP